MMTAPTTASRGLIPDTTFYGMLSETERRWLQERSTSRIYQPGYLMTTEGEPTENVMTLMHGLAVASCVTRAGTKMLLRLYGPGDVLGGEAIINQQVRSETVWALSRCSARVIAADQFADLHRSAGIARAFGLAMFRRVQAADEQARTRLAEPQVRLARVLLDLVARTGVPADNGIITIPVDVSQDTLAAWIAVSRTTVAREFSRLRLMGIIRTGYRQLTITDPVRLGAIADHS
jgi:CRP-like cAMP-binding protein